MNELYEDARYGIRTLVKNPGFALVAVLTLGLGIGANTAIFSLISGVLIKPLPYENSDRLVLVQQSAPLAGQSNVGVSVKEFYDYKERAKNFDALVEYHQMTFDLLQRGEPDRVSTGVVSHQFFDVLGIKPLYGRSFLAEDDLPGAEAVLILSHSYWQSKFGGDPKIVGQVFQMNDRAHRVVGILPSVPHYPQENDVYMSVSACPFRARAEAAKEQNRRGFSMLNVFGRLNLGVSRETAAAEVAAISDRFTRANPTDYRAGSGFTATALGVREELTSNARPMLLILLGTTAMVLLIACANVATLMLARLRRRDRELALRAALGADRGRLIRQLLTESTLLGLAGGLFGLVFAQGTLGLLTSFVSRFTVRTGEVRIDPVVLLFTLAVSAVTGLVFGVFPALASKVDLMSAMKQGGKGAGDVKGHPRLQGGLIVAQVAVSVILLVGAGLLLMSFYRLQHVDPGYRAEKVVSAEVFTNFSRYPNADTQLRTYLPMLERLEAMPGVLSAAVTNAVPLTSLQPFRAPLQIEGSPVDNPDKRPNVDPRIVSSGYFDTLGVPLQQGRGFTESDDREAPAVVIINRSMTRYWDKGSPIGSRISIDNGQTWATVVGIVGDVKQFGLDKDSVAQVYTPLRQTTQGLAGRLLVRTSGNFTAAAQMIKAAVRAIDPDMPIKNIVTLEETRGRYLETPRLTAILLLVFAALALVVTMTGMAGVIANSVSQRTQEFGLRMALGASRNAIMRMVLAQGLGLVFIGLGTGLIVSSATTRVLSGYLYGTSEVDPITMAGVMLAFLATGTAACFGPAWRATKVEPMVALRTE